MAMTAQEKLDAKREKEYNKKHKRMYKLKPGDIVQYFELSVLHFVHPHLYLPILLSVHQHDFR